MVSRPFLYSASTSSWSTRCGRETSDLKFPYLIPSRWHAFISARSGCVRCPSTTRMSLKRVTVIYSSSTPASSIKIMISSGVSYTSVGGSQTADDGIAHEPKDSSMLWKEASGLDLLVYLYAIYL